MRRVWTDAEVRAASWLLGWRAENEGLTLPEWAWEVPHIRAGAAYQGGTLDEARELAKAMGEVAEEEL